MIKCLKERFKSNYQADPVVIAAAPGRVEVIGNHTDYNQGPVIGAAIDRGVLVALRRVDESVFRFSSAGSSVFEISDSSQRQRGEASWLNYPLGVYNALIQRGLKPSGGFEMSVESDVPSGAGLSSSAALELATGKAFSEAYGLAIGSDELAAVGREAENEFVGVPCGILDQGVSACGKAGHLVHIDCRELKFSTIPLGDDFSIWIFNTHKKHSLVESMYSQRHDECRQAVEQLKSTGLDIEYLADVTTEEFESNKEILDTVISKRAEHVIYEIDRVKRVQALLAEGKPIGVGKLLSESHASSRDLFENSVEELDYLVRILESMPDVVGARLTGGGFGGAAMALAGEAFTETYAESVASAYRGYFGESPQVIRCRIADGARVLELASL
ncbi:MAG: galactokinase [Opitutales bacterium]|jgi:galactokinase|nr:galactokinase [Opitutales bacterium]MDG2254577.1 galactokinase [Opitutaceae bacterium]MBT5168902.1 galactokinase [Opitutales bacterium]MBT5814071.1 galactokinase [Opitutales bacterium]MBT6378974.1 galactokinase [Opitutales bacterium]